MIVRPLTADDLDAVKRVIDGNNLFPSELLDDMAAPFLSDEAGDEFWIVAEDQKPIGVAYCAPERMTQGTWNTLLIAVQPDRQGTGVGARLMASVEAAVAARAGRLVLVETSSLPEFASARSFYAGIGYDEAARIRDFYSEGEDKVVFRKALAG